jgi:hypothetical protein
MTLEEWEEQKDRELDESLSALFRSVERPEAPSGLASRTVKAVRRAPLPPGRRALRLPWTTPLGWAALVAAAAATTYGIAVSQPLFVELFASLLAFGIHAGMWLLQLIHTGAAISGVLATTGGVVARAMSTRQATAALTLMTGLAAFSLLMLNKLLFSEKESFSW